MSLHSLENRLAVAWPPADWQDLTILLAVSGGPDSVALLRAMAALKGTGRGRLVAAHINHQLRPGEADADEAFVRELCGRLGVECEVQRAAVDRAAGGHGQGLESQARRARYALLQQIAGRSGARYVVTAHTADDQAETILHRILRGTGIRGLAGMARARPLGPATLLRPLLGIRRAELAAYLADLGQPARRDSSNQDLRFTRNRLRHELLPELAQRFNAGVLDALLRLGSLAGEAQAVIDRLVDELLEQCVRFEGPEAVRIDLAGHDDLSPYLLRELLMAVWRQQGWPLQAMGFEQWDLLAAMLSTGRQTTRGLPQFSRAPTAVWSRKWDCPLPNPAEKQVFPGEVRAEAAAGVMLLRRG